MNQVISKLLYHNKILKMNYEFLINSTRKTEKTRLNGGSHYFIYMIINVFIFIFLHLVSEKKKKKNYTKYEIKLKINKYNIFPKIPLQCRISGNYSMFCIYKIILISIDTYKKKKK